MPLIAFAEPERSQSAPAVRVLTDSPQPGELRDVVRNNDDGHADEHVLQPSATVLELADKMEGEECEHGQHWQQSRVQMEALREVAFEQLNRRTLHATTRALHAEVRLVEARQEVGFD